MLVLGVIAFPIVEVVGASSFPSDLFAVHEQSGTSKQVARFEGDASVVAEASSLSERLRQSDYARATKSARCNLCRDRIFRMARLLV